MDVLQFELDVTASADQAVEVGLPLDADAVDAIIALHAHDGADEEAHGGKRERGGEEEGGLEVGFAHRFWKRRNSRMRSRRPAAP